MKTLIAVVPVALAASVGVAGTVSPFTENFESGANGWLMGSFVAPTVSANGALDGSGYVSSSADLNSAGPFGLTILRGHDEFNASGDAFVGDYLAGGITTVSFDFRHDAGIDLGIAIRMATSGNTPPAFAVELASPVASGEWTTLSFDLSFFNPLLTIEGAPTPQNFEAAMQSIGNFQISADRPDGLTTPFVVNFDFDNIAITPAPASFAMLGLGALVAGRRRRS